MTETKIYWKHKMSQAEHKEALNKLEGNSWLDGFRLFSDCQNQLYHTYFLPFSIRQVIRVVYLIRVYPDEYSEEYDCERVVKYLWYDRVITDSLPEIFELSIMDRPKEFQWPETSEERTSEWILNQLDSEYDYNVSSEDIEDWEVVETGILPCCEQDGYLLNAIAHIPIQLLHNIGGFPLDLEDVI